MFNPSGVSPDDERRSRASALLCARWSDLGYGTTRRDVIAWRLFSSAGNLRCSILPECRRMMSVVLERQHRSVRVAQRIASDSLAEYDAGVQLWICMECQGSVS